MPSRKVIRIQTLPKKTFFLFGPRGVGKSTLLKQSFPNALFLDLLKTELFLRLSRRPGEIETLTGSLKKGDWVVIDEVQRVPEILTEVHALYENKRLNFALSGSSARKLKRGSADMLAGRALQAFLFPFAWPELKGVSDIQEAFSWGTLPGVVTDNSNRKATLESYIEVYLRQELLEEGLLRKLPPFARFLQVAALMNSQVINHENISREAQVGRTTVQTYFEILEDTLIGFKLPAFRAAAKTKEISHAKFYFFDSGVARAAAGLLREELDSSYKGFLFETFMVNQIRAYNHYSDAERNLFFYGISGGSEIDLLIETKRKTMSSHGEVIALEFKSSKKWDPRWNKPIQSFAETAKTKVTRKIGIYLGKERLKYKDFEVWPAEEFLSALFSGNIF